MYNDELFISETDNSLVEFVDNGEKKRKKKKDQSRMNNPEKLETLGKQDTRRRQKTHKNHRHLFLVKKYT